MEGFTLTAAVFSMAWDNICAIRSSLLFAQAREMSTFQYTACRTRLLAVGGYFLGVAGFLFVLPVVHPWISAKTYCGDSFVT